MAKLRKHEVGCKIMYEVNCSYYCAKAISIYLEKRFPNDVVWASDIELGSSRLVEVKYESLQKAIDMDKIIRKFIRDFKISQIEQKSYSELIKFRDSS